VAEPDPASTGILVMAHGGKSEWNAMVEEAVAPLSELAPAVVAFGMADPMTLRAGLDSLHSQGVERVAVVRMFLSGESFVDQTRYYLGLSDTPPENFLLMGHMADHPGAKDPIDHGLEVATHWDGLLDSEYALRIAADRAREMSVDPAGESLLLLAHGMGEEEANDRVLARMGIAAEEIAEHGFAAVEAITLREDWEEPRALAEVRIREFVSTEAEAGRRVLVVPVRLSGFGPYAEVLEGLAYEAGLGLLPHEDITRWIEDTAARVACTAEWGPALGSCPPPPAVAETN
jgi:sirohydrochlorin ferrochelatase